MKIKKIYYRYLKFNVKPVFRTDKTPNQEIKIETVTVVYFYSFIYLFSQLVSWFMVVTILCLSYIFI